ERIPGEVRTSRPPERTGQCHTREKYLIIPIDRKFKLEKGTGCKRGTAIECPCTIPFSPCDIRDTPGTKTLKSNNPGAWGLELEGSTCSGGSGAEALLRRSHFDRDRIQGRCRCRALRCECHQLTPLGFAFVPRNAEPHSGAVRQPRSQMARLGRDS